MSIRILSVAPGSPADRVGIRANEYLEEINSEPVLDEIDYQALSVHSRIRLKLKNIHGEIREIRLRKQSFEPLGLCLDETLQLRPRQCRNHCQFCFIDQMPKGMRETLYVKDDDWRLSLMMGNYVTLTNVDELEFQRILKRKASPLYISVHATDPEIRVRLMRNPNAAALLTQLKRLAENGQQFHCQVVLCPGINDGVILDRTLEDLAALFPAAASLAIVPIGMTSHRQGLTPMKGFTKETAENLLQQILPYQQRFLRELGTRFVFPSDEFYCLSGFPLPSDEEYEDYEQIENGVGMLRQLERECAEAFDDLPHKVYSPRRILIPTGVSAEPFIRQLAEKYIPSGSSVQVLAVHNRFFGESITVTGLIVGRDLIDAVRGIPCDEILISATMLRENSERFLDDMTLESVQHELQIPVRVVGNHGEAFIYALHGLNT